MSRITVRWTTQEENSYSQTFDPQDLPKTIQRAIAEAYEGEQTPFDVDLDDLEIDDVDELADFETDSSETEHITIERTIEGVRFIAPTREELGIPGVISLDEALSDEELSKYGRYFTEAHVVTGESHKIDIVDEALEAGDDYRDEVETDG